MVISNGDAELQAELLEEAMKEAKGNPDMLGDIVRNLGEIGIEGQMGGARTANPERDESYITIYSTLDGTPSTVLRSMAPKTLRKRLANDATVPVELRGKLAFSLAQTIVPPEPTYACMLHPEHPLREWLDEHGLQGKTCYKKLTTAFSARRHLETRHKSENAMIKEEEQRERDDEQRAFQRATIEMMKNQGRGRNAT